MAYDQNAINQIFQQSIGRQGSSSEHSFLAPYIESGAISPYQIGQYLQGSPEAQQARLGQQQSQYQGLLTQNNGQILGQAADAANASFAQNGRQFSSGQGNAVLQAGQQLASQQSPMIASYYGQGQQGLNSQYMSQGQDALSRAYNLTDSNTAYARQLDFYHMQQNDYQNSLNQQHRMNGWMAPAQLAIGVAKTAAQAYGGGA